jgi:hypothetical protein
MQCCPLPDGQVSGSQSMWLANYKWESSGKGTKGFYLFIYLFIFGGTCV